jgi:hypothetical protein
MHYLLWRQDSTLTIGSNQGEQRQGARQLEAQTVVETGSHKHKGAVEDLDKVVLSGLKH